MEQSEFEFNENHDVNAPLLRTTADLKFQKQFIENPFGSSCSVCDRLWFKKDLRPVPSKSHHLLFAEFQETYKNEEQSNQHVDVQLMRVCENCYSNLREGKIPPLSKTNGFAYQPYPSNLPPLDPVTERLISPRIPYMQIRRLRFIKGSKAILGQVINVPVQVNTMVHELPRQLDDDYAFNVSIKKHQIYKSSAYSGFVKKSTVKTWLRYLVGTPLYREEGITIDEDFLKEETKKEKEEDPMIHTIPPSQEKNEEICEFIENNDEFTKELLIAKQHTMLWDEEKVLEIAPGMNRPVVALAFDEHAEELSFPAIYLGHSRQFYVRNAEGNRVPTSKTPYQMSFSEIRRTDRRGVKPEHILYMAMKIMRLRLADGIKHIFKNTNDIKKLTKKDTEDKELMDSMVEQNFAFLKSIPNSIHYWSSRKKDLFAMIKQLGKPTIFLTMSASEYEWDDLLLLLYRLENNGKEWTGEGKPTTSMSSDLRTTLVNEDPVTCCLYFDKLVNTIITILKSKCSPFGKYRILDYFKRIEFQQRGSPHGHLVIWLDNDPKEEISENMPRTIEMIDTLCTVDNSRIQKVHQQTHNHTFTCYKKCLEENVQICRFGAPFWPMNQTRILLPLPKDHGDRNHLHALYSDMHAGLESGLYDSLDMLWKKYHIKDEEHYLNVIRAGITRPRVFLRRSYNEIWINNFHPWIARKLRSNMDIQFILEEYSCAAYVVEYINKTNRGWSNLKRELQKLSDEYPDLDFKQLAVRAGVKTLDDVELSCQEAAWYLLGLGMSESSRKCEYIPTTWPHERHLIRKHKKCMEEEDIDENSTDIWYDNTIQKYEKRSTELENVTLAQFVSSWFTNAKGEWKKRKEPKVIRYVGYDIIRKDDYRREQCLLHYPFRNEETDILNQHKYRELYKQHEKEIMQARKEFESRIDMDMILAECERLFIKDENNEEDNEEKATEYAISKEEHDDFVARVRDVKNDDLLLQIMSKMSSTVRKRENTLSATDYCTLIRKTNILQRDLIQEIIHRIYSDKQRTPLQIFLTGPAGTGKTFTMHAMMETYNRFSKQRNNKWNAYVATASTGVTAAALNGTTVHSAFSINNNTKLVGLKIDKLNEFRAAFADVQALFIDECSMIGAQMLHCVDKRTQQIYHKFDKPFADLDAILCGDLRQLPAVRQTPIYKRRTNNFTNETVWHTLKYYPLEQIMRQSDINFSSILTKIGNGEELTNTEIKYMEARFIKTNEIEKQHPDAIRLFHLNKDIDEYHNRIFNSTIEHETFTADDMYTGYRTIEQLASTRNKVHKMKTQETNKLPYLIELAKEKPYMILQNIDVLDGIVNGAIGTLKFVERCADSKKIKRLWLKFNNPKIGKLLRAKAIGHYATNPNIQKEWTPIKRFEAKIPLASKIITVKRSSFPITPACAITIHKSQGSTYEKIVYEYSKTHEQQLVYVALSRCKTYEGLYLTNSKNDFTFYHGKENITQNIRQVRTEIERLSKHRLRTHAEICRNFINTAGSQKSLTLASINVQSLKAHFLDVTEDFILPNCNLITMTETWLSETDCKTFNLKNYKLINCHKRKNGNIAGGVAIYERCTNSTIMNTTACPIFKMQTNDTKLEEINVCENDIGDICKAETTINNQRTILTTIYFSNSANTTDKIGFLRKYLQPYSIQTDGLHPLQKKMKLYNQPMILYGDFNIDFRSEEGKHLCRFIEEYFNCKLSNSIDISTTRNMTCIDGIFTRYIPKIQTKVYTSYFSHHHPLLTTNVTL